MNASFGTHKTLLLNQSYPPSIMQYNNNINNISPPSNNNNINTINNSVSANIADATSIHNDEGTNTDDSRKVSDRHALPQQQKTIIILQGLNVNVIGLQALASCYRFESIKTFSLCQNVCICIYFVICLKTIDDCSK
eukprot:22587_1